MFVVGMFQNALIPKLKGLARFTARLFGRAFGHDRQPTPVFPFAISGRSGACSKVTRSPHHRQKRLWRSLNGFTSEIAILSTRLVRSEFLPVAML